MPKRFTYIDAHAHLNFDRFDEDRAEVIEKLAAEGGGAINVGIDVETSHASLELARDHSHIWATVGCHPTEVTADFSIVPYRKLVKEAGSELVAVGECGLDYLRDRHQGEAAKEQQKAAFRAHIELALAEDLPLILHLRPSEGTMDAYEDGLEILEEYADKAGDTLRGTAHFFVGDEEIAERFVDLGFYLSATGPVTFDETLQKTFAKIPVEHLLVETDTPFAAPKSQRGRRNSPLFIPEIIATLAELKDMDPQALTHILTENTQKLFDLPTGA